MRLVGASDRYVRWPFIIEGPAHRRHRVASSRCSCSFSPRRPISDLARAIAGQVPVGFERSLTDADRERSCSSRGLGLGGARRLDQRARLPAQLSARRTSCRCSGRPRATRTAEARRSSRRAAGAGRRPTLVGGSLLLAVLGRSPSSQPATAPRAARAPARDAGRTCGGRGVRRGLRWYHQRLRRRVGRRRARAGRHRGHVRRARRPLLRLHGPDEFGPTLADICGEFEGIGARMAPRGRRRASPATSSGRAASCVVVDVLADSPARGAGLLRRRRRHRGRRRAGRRAARIDDAVGARARAARHRGRR